LLGSVPRTLTSWGCWSRIAATRAASPWPAAESKSVSGVSEELPAATARVRAIQLSWPRSRARACCTSRSVGSGGAPGWARDRRARAAGSPSRRDLSHRLAALRRVSTVVTETSFRSLPDVRLLQAGRRFERRLRTTMGGSGLPCRGQEAPQRALESVCAEA